MEQSYWIRHRPTHRDFLRGIGMAAGVLTLAPAIAACRGSAGQSNGGNTAGGGSAARPVRGGTLTSSMNGDVINLDYAFNSDLYSQVIVANCVEPLLTVDTEGLPTGLAGDKLGESG